MPRTIAPLLRNADLHAALVLFAAVLLFFGPGLGGQRTLLPVDILRRALDTSAPPPHNELLSDMVLENLVWKQFLRESIRQGALPFWNPHVFSGTPFLATGQNSALYPLGVIFLVLPLPLAYTWFAALHVLLMALGAYGFLRALGAGPPGALVGALAVAFSSVVTTTLMWPMVTSTLAWVPWLLLCLERGNRGLERGEGWRSLALWGPLAAVTIGLMFLAGHSEYAGYGLAIAGWSAGGWLCWWLLKRRTLGRWWAAVPGWTLTVLLGLGLAAPLLWPFLRLAPLNFRAGLVRYEEVVGYALPIEHLVALVVPDVFGNPGHHRYFDFFSWQWRPVTEARDEGGAPRTYPFWGTKNYVEGAGFASVSALVLAGGALLLRRDRATITFASLALVALLLAFGTPLYRLLFALPGLDQLHTPFRWLYPYTFSVAILAGLGSDHWLRQRGRGWQRLALLVIAGGALLLSVLVLSRLFPELSLQQVRAAMEASPRLARAFGGDPAFLYSYEAWNLLLLAASLLGMGLVLRAARTRPSVGPWPLAGLAAAALVAAELLPSGARFIGWSPAQLPGPPDFVRFLQERGESLARVASFGPGEPLTPNLAALYGLWDARGYDSVILRSYIEFWRLIEEPAGLLANRVQTLTRSESLQSPLLDLLGVRYILSRDPLPAQDGPAPLYAGEVFVYENPDALPRAFVVPQAIPVADEAAALAALRSPAFDPRRMVVLEASGEPPSAHTPAAEAGFAPASVLRYGPNSVEVRATLTAPGYLVLMDAYAPQWRATVDGAPVRLYKANGAFRAVALGPGEHVVHFTYATTEFRWGLLVAGLSGLTVVGLLGARIWSIVAAGAGTSAPARVIKNTLTPLTANLFNRAVDLAFAVFMVRLLGPELAGRYAFAVVFIGYFAIATDFGLGTLLTREVSRRPDQAGRLLVNVLWLRLLLWTIALLALAVVLLLYRQLSGLTGDTVITIVLLAFALLPQAIASAFSALFQAHERMEVPALVSVGTNLMKVALGVPVLLAGGGILGLGAVALVTTALTALVFWALARLLLRPPPGQRDPGYQRTLAREAAPLMVNSLLNSIFFRVDILLLQPLRGDRETGWYSTAYKFLDGLLLIPSLFTLAAFPLLSRYATQSPNALRRATQRGLKALLLIAFPVAAGMTLIADQLVRFLFGPEFAPSSRVLQLLVWFFPLSVINGYVQYVLIALNQQRFITIAFFVAATFNLLANLVAIPLWGMMGAAATTVLSELALLAPFLWMLRRHLGGIGLTGLMVRPALAAAAMGVLLWPLLVRGWPFLGLVPLGVILYTGALVVLRALDEEDWALVRSLLTRRPAQSDTPVP